MQPPPHPSLSPRNAAAPPGYCNCAFPPCVTAGGVRFSVTCIAVHTGHDRPHLSLSIARETDAAPAGSGSIPPHRCPRGNHRESAPFLPVSSQCTKPGCSRFRPTCSGSPATNVCCSSPGLRSSLRPRSAASWAPPIGRRTETGTCLLIDTPNNPAKTGVGEKMSRDMEYSGWK